VPRLDSDEGITVAFPDREGERAAMMGDVHSLTILLRADRCEGAGACGRVEALVAQNGVATRPVGRGYLSAHASSARN
jgi:hypothetical protein